MAVPTVSELVSFVTSTTADVPDSDIDVFELQTRLVTVLSHPDKGLPDALSQARAAFGFLTEDDAGEALDVMLESLAAHLLYDWSESVEVDTLEMHLFDITWASGALVADMYLWGWTVAAYGGVDEWEGPDAARVKGWLRFRAPSETLLARGCQGWATFAEHWGVDRGDAAAYIAAVHTHLASRWLQRKQRRP